MIRSAFHNDRFLNKTAVADIKLNAREAVNKEAQSASAITLIKLARAQTLSAREHEAKGDLRNALASFIKAETLVKMVMDSTEFTQETRSKGGVLWNELTDFVERDGHDINACITAVEDKLKAMEVAQPTSALVGSDGPKPVADLLRTLQNNSLVSHINRFLSKIRLTDIKLNARKTVNREAQDAPSFTLIKTARAQTLSAMAHEAKGDLGNASTPKAPANMAMDSVDFAQETRINSFVLLNEITNFIGDDIYACVTLVEDKLKATEVAQLTSALVGSDGPKSVADLLQTLLNNGLAFHHDRFLDKITVADIKLNARQAVKREAQGAPAITLIKIARAQTLFAKEHEAEGNLMNALASFIKAETLVKMVRDSTDFAQGIRSAGKGGYLLKEATDIVVRDINVRVTAVEDKLKAIEVAHPISALVGSDVPRSITDRP